GGATVVVGALTSTPDTTYTVELYRNGSCDASGFGEGQTLVHTEAVTTDSAGTVTFEFTVTPAIATGFGLTATATDPQGNTSEFSNCLLYTVPLSILEVTLQGPGTGTVTSTPVGLALDGTPGAACTGSQGSLCRLVVPQNTVIDQLVAQAGDGTNFIGWSGDKCRGQEPCTFSVTAPRTVVTASFCPSDGSACGLPQEPVGFVCQSYWPNSVTCSWQPVSAAIGYRVFLGTASRTYTQFQDVGLVTTHTFTGLTPNVRYFLAVASLQAPAVAGLVGAAATDPPLSGLSGEVTYDNVLAVEEAGWQVAPEPVNAKKGPAAWKAFPDPVEVTLPPQVTESSGVYVSETLSNEVPKVGSYIARPTLGCRRDYTLTVNLQTFAPGADGPGAQGVLVRYRDDSTYYRVALDWAEGVQQPRLRVVKQDQGVFTLLGETFINSTSLHLPMPNETELRVEVQGEQLTVFVGGTQQLSVSDPTPLEGLGLGVYTWRNPDNNFDVTSNTSLINFANDPPTDCATLEVVPEGTGSGEVSSTVVSVPPNTEAVETVALPGAPQAAYPVGTQVQLLATPTDPSGGPFEGWRGCVATPVMTPTLLVTMDQVKTCRVRFGGTPTQLVTWDVDANGVADERDAGMLTRWAFGLRGPAMVEGLVDPNGERADAGAMATHLEPARISLADVDGDGMVGALTDMQVVTRFFQARANGKTEEEIRADSTLLTGVVSSTAQRNPMQILNHLFDKLPSNREGISALTATEAEGSVLPIGTIAEPTLTPTVAPAPVTGPEEVTKSGRRKGHHNKKERRRKFRQ
ncbi:MAG: fibronectin type III domain-containing protein, partial [Nitrospirota bacterium]|nr:fibronectin type III domain-containing protein [Nitrospirota bacterium]